MLICSRVCAEFHDRNGIKIFSVTQATRMCLIEAPESITQDPLFHLLLNEGSLEAVQSVPQRERLEKDPAKGSDASGKLLPQYRVPDGDEASDNSPLDAIPKDNSSNPSDTSPTKSSRKPRTKSTVPTEIESPTSTPESDSIPADSVSDSQESAPAAD